MWSTVVAPLLLLLVVGLAEGQRPATQAKDRVVSECPLPNGFFADAQQCDRYYECVDNVITEKVCPDGLAFVDHNPRAEKCDYISAVDCTGRPDLQPAQPAGACLRQNGYFYHPDPTICNQFFFCSEGKGNLVTCPVGLVFNTKTNNCVWADEAGRTGCASDTGNPAFECPKVTHDVAVTHPRYADPSDCQFFYVCIDGVNARRNGCTLGQVFNDLVGTCTPPADVPECSNYYNDYFDDYFSKLSPGGRPSGDIIAAAFEAGYDIPLAAFGKGDRTPNRRPGTDAAPAGVSGGPRRRRPSSRTAAAAPVAAPAPAAAQAPLSVPIPTQAAAPADSFTLSTDFGEPAQDAPAPAQAADPPRRRRPLVNVRKAPRPQE